LQVIEEDQREQQNTPENGWHSIQQKPLHFGQRPDIAENKDGNANVEYQKRNVEQSQCD